jgi:hypothetical protein
MSRGPILVLAQPWQEVWHAVFRTCVHMCLQGASHRRYVMRLGSGTPHASQSHCFTVVQICRHSEYASIDAGHDSEDACPMCLIAFWLKAALRCHLRLSSAGRRAGGSLANDPAPPLPLWPVPIQYTKGVVPQDKRTSCFIWEDCRPAIMHCAYTVHNNGMWDLEYGGAKQVMLQISIRDPPFS